MYLAGILPRISLPLSQLNEATRQVRQLQIIVDDRLRRGDVKDIDSLLLRVSKAIQQPGVVFSEEAILRLSTAQLLEIVNHPQRSEAMLTRLIGIMGKGFLQIAAEVDRFRARLRLNCKDLNGAWEIANTIDRRLIERHPGAGRLSELLVEDDERMLSSPTWILLAELALTGKEPKKVKLFIQKARARAAVTGLGVDEEILCRLIETLAYIHEGDLVGLVMLAHLYLECLEDEEREINRFTAPIRSCVLACAGDSGPFKGISLAEAERWKALGPGKEAINNYLQQILDEENKS
jgi:hypothetical protein